MHAPRLILVTGISCSGKSVLAKAIQTSTGFARIDPDEISRAMGQGLHGEWLSDAQWADIHAQSRRRAVELLRRGQGVVYDTVLFTRDQRQTVQHLAEDLGYSSMLVWVDTPRFVAYARWADNNYTRSRALVHIDDFEMCARHFVPPQEHEPHVTFRWNEDLLLWIHRHVGTRLTL